jgi:flagellar biosynthesis GTPase FlhF
MGLLGGLGFAVLFYAAAEYEHMSGWKWAVASLALSVTVRSLFPFSFVFVLPAQFGLFGVMWWMNTKRMKELEADRAAHQEDDRRRRQEQARQAREQVDPDEAKREAARAARDAEELRQRQERVRRAREERERDERQQAERDKGQPSG